MCLLFEYSSFVQEMRAFATSAAARSSTMGLDGVEGLNTAVDRLLAIQTSNHKNLSRWTHAEWAPIRTTTSNGAFMPGGHGGVPLVGRLEFVWEIRNHGAFRKTSGHRMFELAGNASCKIFLDSASTGRTLAMWRFEVAASDGPGCHFHVQVLGDDEITCGELFPHSVDIPRLPSILFTPTDALEFVLGELFQDEWGLREQGQTPDLIIWRSHQRERLSRILEWQQQAIVGAVGSPWVTLKRKKPERELFVGKSSK